jgi:hypothetical protein
MLVEKNRSKYRFKKRRTQAKTGSLLTGSWRDLESRLLDHGSGFLLSGCITIFGDSLWIRTPVRLGLSEGGENQRVPMYLSPWILLNDPHLEGEGFVLCRLKPTESCWYSLLFSINNWTRIHTEWHPFIRANPCPVFSSSYLLWPYRHAEFQAFEIAVCEQPWLVDCVDFATLFFA